MSKNLTRKGLAFGTILAFAATGLTGIAPASAAAGDYVSVAPTTGTGWGAFSTDSFSFTSKVDTDVVTNTALQKLALEVTQSSSLDVTLGGSAQVDTVAVQTVQTAGSTTTQDLTDDRYSVTVGTIALLSNDVSSTEAFVGGATTPNLSLAAADAQETSYLASTVTLNGLDVNFTVGDVKYTKATIALNGYESTDIAVSAPVATPAANTSVGIATWIDADGDLVRDDSNQSKAETINFYLPSNVTVTPRIERFVTANDLINNGHGAETLGASLVFTPALNLDQVDLTNVAFSVSNNGTFVTQTDAVAHLAGNTTSSADGRIYLSLTTTDLGATTAPNVITDSLEAGRAYVVKAAVTNGKTASSAGFTVPKQTTTTTPASIELVDSVAVTAAADSELDGAAASLRTGTKSFTYAAAADSAKAGVPVIAVVRAIDLVAGSKLTVGTQSIGEGAAAMLSGSTDATGSYSVSVESSTAKTGEQYSVSFYVLGTTGAWTAADTTTATYVASAVSSVTPSATIIAGATPSVKFTVKDQFGQLVSKDADGNALVVKAVATTAANLDKYLPVENGVATLSFTNYVTEGSSDSISYNLGTGSTDSTWAQAIAGSTIALYNPGAVAAVTVDEAIADKAITYDAFITGTANTTTNVAPAAGDSFVYTGTIVDGSSQGVAGAVVTVAAAGLQFQDASAEAGDFFQDSITVSADAAGVFSVNVWAHKVSSTGITITTTSGGKSATTKLTTVANGVDTGSDAVTAATLTAPAFGAGDITADDLVFTWDAPAKLVVDTTYIVTAKVADKWGNPIAGANLDFSADGAIQVNSLDAVSNKLTNASGIVRVYLRSLAKTTGVGSFSATLDGIGTEADGGIEGTVLSAADITASTKVSDVLSADLDVVASIAPVAVANASGSTGKVFVSVTNAAGKKVVVKVSGKFAKSFTGTAAKKTVAIAALKGKRTVTIFVGGALVSTKVVTIK